MTRILVVDNYDSFTYNLVQYVGELVGEGETRVGNGDASEVDARVGNRNTDEVLVRRNDEVDVAGIRELDPDGIVVSPGPGVPEDAGVSIAVFRDLSYPALGVCLGHQALCAANGATVEHAPEVVHGKPSTVTHDGTGVFAGLPERLEVGRYHSLCVRGDDIPDTLVETAVTDEEREVVMGVRHRERPHIGVQFHPESILTADGKAMVRNFIGLCTDRDSATFPVDGAESERERGER